MSGINLAKLDNCLVVGNGESRKDVDLNQFKENFTIIGCNALHRDYIVDHIVCCDRRMVEEVVTNLEYTNSKIHVRDDWYHYYRKIRKNKNVIQLPEIPYSPKYKQDEKRNWGSGTYAVLIAAQMGFKNVSLIGFDLYGNNSKVNNVYKNTPNYSLDQSQPVDPAYWIYQLAQTFSLYPNINFTVINNQDWVMPHEWKKLNVKLRNLNDFFIDNKYSCSTIVL